jgi:hypothetical protein
MSPDPSNNFLDLQLELGWGQKLPKHELCARVPLPTPQAVRWAMRWVAAVMTMSVSRPFRRERPASVTQFD